MRISEMFKESTYTYSDPIVIREWPGGKIWVQVGYVKKHPEKNQVTLFKQYPTKQGPKEDKYNIRGESDWTAIRAAVERLWPELKQEASPEVIEASVRKVGREVELLDLVAKYPEVLSRVPQDIDILTLPDDQKEALRKLLAVGGTIAQRVIKKLAEQEVDDLAGLVKILEELRLSTVTSLVNHVSSRLAFIEAFERAIHNDQSYERQGTDSIHGLLRSNIWILNPNYSVLHDDETLRNIIQQQFQQEMYATDPALKRPDFLCMTGKREEDRGIDKLVIIEIKRPSVTLTMEHVTQLMEYKSILERYSGKSIGSFKCYLVGRERHPLLLNNDLSASGFVVKTYTDFISEARQFYQEYLEIVQQDKLAI